MIKSFPSPEKECGNAVMNKKDYSFQEEMLDLHKKLLEAEEQRQNGAKTYSLEEASSFLNKVIGNESAIQ